MIINKFDNAYGIKGLNLKSLNGILNNMCIYASNGVFKSSFSRAFFNLTEKNGEVIKDRIKDKRFEYDISVNEVNYSTDDTKIIPNLIVYSKELYEEKSVDKNSGFTQLLLLPEYQKELALVYEKSDEYVDEIIKYAEGYGIKLKSLSEVATLADENSENPMAILKNLYNQMLKLKPLESEYIDFKKLDQKAYDIIDSKAFKEEVNKYTSIINRKLNSKLFDEKFNDTNHESLIAILEETGFLNESRNIVIDGDNFNNIEDFKKRVNEELETIKSDPEVIAQYNNVLKLLGVAKEAKVVKDLLKDESKILELSLGRKNLKISKIRNKFSDEELKLRLETIDSLEKKVNKIIMLSKSKTSHFENAIEIYINRFKPKFKINVENLYEARLGYEIPKISFSHKDNVNKSYNELEIYKLLSSGERNALKTVHLIVRYEAVKESKPIIILDDVVETFDYANRIAFLMYLKEIKDNGSNIILLTHNFDFYRVAISRVGLKPSEAFIDKNGHVVIRVNQKFQLSYDRIKKIESYTDLFSAIPFVREISAMCNGEEKNDDYHFFTRLLHVKHDSKEIKIEKVLERIKSIIPSVNTSNYIGDLNQGFVDLLITHDFGQSIESNDLKAKLAISMAIRLMLEDKVINDDYSKIEDCKCNQTIYLFEKYDNILTDSARAVFEKVLLSTPEFIHFNSFMYEPLVDIDPKDLLIVYDEVRELESVFKQS